MKRQSVDLKPARPRVAILLLERCWAGSVMLWRELLQASGALQARSTDVEASALFEIALVGLNRRPVASFGGLRLTPDATLQSFGQADIVLIPAQFAPTEQTTAEEQRYAAWLQAQREGGALLVSVASALLLAKAGLLDRREATGLLGEREIFRRRFPQVRYLPARRVVVGPDIVTACGIGPTADVCAHLIERHHGARLAARFLRHTSIEAMPAAEETALWSARYKRHRDEQVLAVQEILEKELYDIPPLATLARRVALSERSLGRRMVAATGLTLRDYVAELRIERGQALLREGTMPLIHVAQDCGFGSVAAFSRAFAARHGLPPAAYRRERGRQ